MLKSDEKWSIFGVAPIFANSAIYWKFVDTNGGLPCPSSYIMQPNAHKSLWKLYTPLVSNNYGAMYDGVPFFFPFPFPIKSTNLCADPKSPIFKFPYSFTKIDAGLISQTTIPFEWAYCIPPIISKIKFRTVCSGSCLSYSIIFSKSPPGQYSVIYHMWFFVSIKSKNFIMFWWLFNYDKILASLYTLALRVFYNLLIATN